MRVQKMFSKLKQWEQTLCVDCFKVNKFPCKTCVHCGSRRVRSCKYGSRGKRMNPRAVKRY